MNKLHFVIPATTLFALLATLLFVRGGEWVQAIVIWALLTGAVSQWIAQDDGPSSQVVAWLMAWFSIFLSIIAVIIFTI
ncbi:hypothetical protein EVB31_022 [Rhizobium phage RHph_TM29]|nr:hypothetical protein EVB29_022 [Rhizobium phage RHph_TM27A]QIG66942.1 hypothetical protein EVB30_022 [Rhizobium phage RHph_TM27B]QIG67032.1 hypothetical protein EVB31_022 [Rhizobium phage RHph_TM29]